MSEHKFKAFLLSRQWSDILRDFVDHAQTDDALPDAKSWDELEAYLKGKDAVESVIKSAEHIWGLYVADTNG